MILYYITGRTLLAPDEPTRERLLLDRIAAAARAGVDYIQLREKDLPVRKLESLAAAAVKAVRDHSSTTRLLVNSRADVALACRADGVHLRGHGDLWPADARSVMARAGAVPAVIAASCHSLADVAAAESHGADFAVFAPVFEKAGAAPAGLAALRKVCRRRAAARPAMPVLALGGVTLKNARSVLQAGAAGVAGIRLFQEGEVAETVSRLRELSLE